MTIATLRTRGDVRGKHKNAPAGNSQIPIRTISPSGDHANPIEVRDREFRNSTTNNRTNPTEPVMRNQDGAGRRAWSAITLLTVDLDRDPVPTLYSTGRPARLPDVLVETSIRAIQEPARLQRFH
jgi:hypothetical protein